MRYISTRGEAPVLGFEDVVLAGLARDGGLYVPETWPRFTADDIRGLQGLPFHEVAVRVMRPFVGGAITDDVLAGMAAQAYSADVFGHPAVVPLVQIGPNRFVLELFHGPTLAFKDLAMQLLARLMDHVLEKRGLTATIAGATSGDTGGAAVAAFRNLARVDVVILFPDGRVSDVQRRMMTAMGGDNISALAIEGTFDDCQALVKGMFNDLKFRDRVRLAGVNSINWARILAQVSYYFAAAAALGAPDRRVSFSVPTGNFGDIFAGWVAKQMGLPTGALVIASNANDILPRTVETGVYEKRGVVATSSPSMDIQVSSNFERLLFEASGRDAARVRGMMASLGQSGRFELGDIAPRVREEFRAAAATETDVSGCITRIRAQAGYVLDPHTACGVVAAERTLRRGDGVEVVLATAHPAKFPDAMAAATGERPELPRRLDWLMRASEVMDKLPNDLVAVERYVEAKSRAARGTA